MGAHESVESSRPQPDHLNWRSSDILTSKLRQVAGNVAPRRDRRRAPALTMVEVGTDDVCFTACLVAVRRQTPGPGGVLVPSGSLAGTNEQ